MNQVQDTQKDRVMKTLAIFGFLAVIILGVWLAVQIVKLMPQAFTSLASIADGVYNTRNAELMVETENSSVATGEVFNVSWNDIGTDGSYSFSYECTDGVSVTVVENTGSPVTLSCGETLTLGGDMTDVAVSINSERDRMVDVAYTIGFMRQGETEMLVASNNSVTVVNDSIPVDGMVAGEMSDEDMSDEDTSTETEEPIETEEEPVEVVEEPEVSTPLPPAPTVIETVIMETPVSDPNGRVDLAIRLVAVGQLNSEGDFVQRSRVDNDGRGAFQFEVRNVGTKTSDEWDFIATLTSGTEYNAPTQTPLKPQERVLFTLGYDNVGEDGISLIGARLRGGADTNSANNSFTWAVSVVE